MAQTGERINRRCAVELPADLYKDADAAVLVRCEKGEGHGGVHRATINSPRTVEWVGDADGPTDAVAAE